MTNWAHRNEGRACWTTSVNKIMTDGRTWSRHTAVCLPHKKLLIRKLMFYRIQLVCLCTVDFEIRLVQARSTYQRHPYRVHHKAVILIVSHLASVQPCTPHKKKVLFVPESVFLYTFLFALGGNSCLVLVRYTCGSIKGVRRVGHVAHMERKMCFGWGTPRKETT